MMLGSVGHWVGGQGTSPPVSRGGGGGGGSGVVSPPECPGERGDPQGRGGGGGSFGTR